MLYSQRKYKFLWVLRRTKLIVLALQILMWTLKISPRMFSLGASDICPVNVREGSVGLSVVQLVSALSLGSSSQMRRDLLLPRQRHLYAGHLRGVTTKPGGNPEFAREERPSTISASLGRWTSWSLPEVPSSSTSCPTTNTQRQDENELPKWSLFTGWVSKGTQWLLFPFQKDLKSGWVKKDETGTDLD